MRVRMTKIFLALKAELDRLDFYYSPAPGIAAVYKHRFGWEVAVRRDGYFHVTFPDGHGGDMQPKSLHHIDSTVRALRAALTGSSVDYATMDPAYRQESVIHTHDGEGKPLSHPMTTDEASRLGIQLYE